MARAKVENVALTPITKGMQSRYSHYSAAPDSWNNLENFHNDSAGYLITRSNLGLCDTVAATSQSTVSMNLGNTTVYLTKTGTSIRQYNAYNPQAAFNVIASVFSNTLSWLRASQVGNTLFMVAPGNNIMYSTDGVTFANAPNLTSMNSSQNTLIQAGFVGRVWSTDGGIIPINAGRLFYSDVLPATNFYNVTNTNGLYLDLNTKGMPLTAMVDADNILYCFTNSNITRVYNTQSIDNSPYMNIGTLNQESVVRIPDAILFLNTTGVYQIKRGLLTKVSQDIDDFIALLALPYKNNSLSQPAFGWSDGEAAYWSVDLGNYYLPENAVDRTYIIRYNYIFGIWSIFSLKDVQVTSACGVEGVMNAANTENRGFPSALITADYLINPPTGLTSVTGLFAPTLYGSQKPFQNGTTIDVPVGDWTPPGIDSAGAVNTSQATRPVYCNATTQWITFGSENSSKNITGITVAHENAVGLQVFAQVDNQDKETSDRSDGVWTEIGTLDGNYVTFFRDWQSLDFFRIRFRVAGQALGIPIKVGEIRFLIVQNNGYGSN
jgi:hypothetical protein